MTDTYFDLRLAKLESYSQKYTPKYPDRFEKSHYCGQIKQMVDGENLISCAGRLIALRIIGKITFGHISDSTGRIQIGLTVDSLGKENYKFLLKHLDIGDFIGVSGYVFTTKKGEKTINVKNCRLLAKSLRPLPEKWHGLSDPELRARQRYLDLISNNETFRRFDVRNRSIKFIRNYLDSHNFFEVETPILQSAASGASARPFKTHHNALDIPLYLRIAPETYLKRLMVGGYERIYEIGKCFRNEGIDASHLQEFTMLEFYVAYWNYKDIMNFIQSMLKELLEKVHGTLVVEYQGKSLDFSTDWPEIKFTDLVMENTGIDLNQVDTLEDLKEEVKNKNLGMDVNRFISLGGLIDGIYKKICRPKLIQPIFLIEHPKELVPLARLSDEIPGVLDMFQLVVNSWELVKAYSELIDPKEQYKRLGEQQKLLERGEDEAMMFEEDFVVSMEYGMPPMAGLGFGIDRFLCLITGAKNIRDVIYFPSLKPIRKSELDNI